MADCVFKRVNNYNYVGCSSKKHPSFDAKKGCTPLKSTCPAACNNGGKGCPIFAKEKAKKKKR